MKTLAFSTSIGTLKVEKLACTHQNIRIRKLNCPETITNTQTLAL